MKSKLLITILLFNLIKIYGQVTEITPGGSTQPNITATSTTNGIVFPRMSTAQKVAMSSVVSGTMVYDTDLNCLNLYNGTEWTCLNTPTISNGLTFQNLQLTLNPSGNCPLCGSIAVTASQPIKLSYTVKGQDGEDFTFTNTKISIRNDTTISLYGLYPNYTNTVIIKITSILGQVSERTLYVKTDVLPADLPQSNEIIVNARNSNVLTKFILNFPIKTKGAFNSPAGALVSGYPTVIDSYGKIRWYLKIPLGVNTIMQPLKNDNWLLAFDNTFKEIDLSGNIIKNIPLPFMYHHDVAQLPNEDLIYLGNSNLNNTIEDKIYTINFNTGAVIDSLNLYTILDPLRPQLPVGLSNDWFHANSITYDDRDNSIIVSGRHQSAVVKIDLATKQLKWILSDSTNWNSTLKPFLLKPSGSNFEYAYGQHSAVINLVDKHKILLWDDGNSRSYTNPLPPTSNYSRAVEYSIDEQNKTIVQNFDFGKSYGSAIFSPYVGTVSYLNNSHIFIGDGGILKDINNNAVELNPNARNQIRLFEVDKDQNVYLDISIKNPNISEPSLIGFRSYRSYPFSFK